MGHFLILLFFAVRVQESFATTQTTPRASADATPIIESIEGDEFVVVLQPSGKALQGKKGTPVQIGDRVKTGNKTSAKIKYPDGSRLLVGRGTEVEVQENKDDVQYNKVYSGYVRGLIRKTGKPESETPPRFIIRSRTVVMGVRGTDFTMNQAAVASNAEIHTLEGVVEVAKSDEELMSGKGFRVEKDQMISADQAKIEPPKPFDRRVLDKVMQASQPDFKTFIAKDPEMLQAAYTHTGVQNSMSMAGVDGKDGQDENRPPRWQPGFFQANGVYSFQDSGGTAFSPQVSWTPTFRLLSFLHLRPGLGFIPFKSRTLGKTFVAMEVMGLVSLNVFGIFRLEPGVVFYRWGWGEVGRNSTNGMVQVSFNMDEKGWFERIFVGYSQYKAYQYRVGFSQQEDNPIHMIKAGVGIRF
ncbi:MAG: FecR domain-containing protein [Bdellovibrionales bacterium]|nr:FecR domain-containing protein [Bdellovibrionales bacterium]